MYNFLLISNMNCSKKQKPTLVMIIVIVGALAFLGAVMLTVVVPVVTIPPQQEAVAQQQQDNTATTQSIMPASSNKTFYVFTAEIEGLNETAAKIAGDIYSLPEIEVNRGDSVTVHFYNLDETGERHSFTIDAQPYSVDIDVAGDQSGNATFIANQEGIFPYYCKYHLPTMTGELVVLPPPQSSGASPPAT
jgi:plastocyanin